MADKKLSFGEWLFAGTFASAAMLVLYVVLLPFGLLVAWTRVKMWDWFIVPYFHLPHVPLWLMLGIGILVSSFQPPQQSIKDEYYDHRLAKRVAIGLFTQLVSFLMACAIHIWVLKG